MADIIEQRAALFDAKKEKLRSWDDIKADGFLVIHRVFEPTRQKDLYQIRVS
jgi:hypothetical protein